MRGKDVVIVGCCIQSLLDTVQQVVVVNHLELRLRDYMKGQEILFSKKSDEWTTPQSLFDELNREFHFDIDVAASVENTKCKNYITEGADALSVPWDLYGNPAVCFCNPPYSQWQKFVEKAFHEWCDGQIVVMLLPARTDTKAFHEYIYKKPYAEVRFIKGRLKFGDSKNSAPFPSMIVIFR